MQSDQAGPRMPPKKNEALTTRAGCCCFTFIYLFLHFPSELYASCSELHNKQNISRAIRKSNLQCLHLKFINWFLKALTPVAPASQPAIHNSKPWEFLSKFNFRLISCTFMRLLCRLRSTKKVYENGKKKPKETGAEKDTKCVCWEITYNMNQKWVCYFCVIWQKKKNYLVNVNELWETFLKTPFQSDDLPHVRKVG